MGQKQEDIIRDFLAAWGDEQHRPDVERIVSMFAPDGQWVLYVPNGPVIRGRAALRAEIDQINMRIYDTVNNGVYKAGFAMLPTVDHVARPDGRWDFVICAWRTNDAKNDLSHYEFIDLCRRVIAHTDRNPASESSPG